MTYLKCTSCQRLKPLRSAFPRNATKANGVDTECKRCKRNREGTPEAREEKRFRALYKKYGITEEAYWALHTDQLGLCAICEEPEFRTNAYGEELPLVVDHDHATGRVRGLLCSGCNKALGLFKDDQELLNRAVNYLEGWSECEPF